MLFSLCCVLRTTERRQGMFSAVSLASRSLVCTRRAGARDTRHSHSDFARTSHMLYVVALTCTQLTHNSHLHLFYLALLLFCIYKHKHTYAHPFAFSQSFSGLGVFFASNHSDIAQLGSMTSVYGIFHNKIVHLRLNNLLFNNNCGLN